MDITSWNFFVNNRGLISARDHRLLRMKPRLCAISLFCAVFVSKNIEVTLFYTVLHCFVRFPDLRGDLVLRYLFSPQIAEVTCFALFCTVLHCFAHEIAILCNFRIAEVALFCAVFVFKIPEVTLFCAVFSSKNPRSDLVLHCFNALFCATSGSQR